MKTIYIADDGKEFDDEYECEEYEWRLKHPYLSLVCLYDKDGNRISDNVMSEDVYDRVEKIIINSPLELNDFIDFAAYSGFDAYESINAVGEWEYNEEEGLFVKCEKKLFAYWGSVYGEDVVGVINAYNENEAKCLLRNTYDDFDNWDDYDLKRVVFDDSNVHEIYYG